jgi:hypothetical protein
LNAKEGIEMFVPNARQNKRALLVGINQYPNLPIYSQLRGCVNDVLGMRQMLEDTFNFPPSNVRVLLNEEATEKAIREAMDGLIEDCGEGDIVVFHFSGHGSQMAAKGDKPRGYDESIMPYDSGRDNPAFPVRVEPRDIRDTDIQEWLSHLTRKTPHVTLIFDSCHSGSITRYVTDSEEYGTRLRWIPPDPLPGQPSFQSGPPAGRGHAREAGGSGWLPPSDSYVLLAACAAEQGAYEYEHEGERYGAFTFFLTHEIQQEFDRAANKITYRDLWERVAIKVNQQFQKQTPQLEGARDKLIFDVHDLTPMRYLLVTSRRDVEVQLGGGAVHGLTTGSRWDIYPAGAKQISEASGTRLGTVEVTSVGAVTASARIVAESHPEAIAPSARAVEASHVDPETRMTVRLAPAPKGYEGEIEGLRLALEGSELLKLVGCSEGARAEIRIVSCEETAGGDGPSPGGSIPTATVWEVTDGSSLLMRRYRVGAADVRSAIRENLETIWRFHKTLELRNDKSRLNGKIDFILLKKSAGGEWEELPEGEVPTYEAGDSIAFRVVNRSEALVYVSILDLGLSKRVDLLYPQAGPSEPVAVKRAVDSAGGQSGGVLSVGERAEDEIELFFPDDHTFISEAKDGEPQCGTEYFKLIVTTQRHDLSFLKQSGLRREPEHPLEKVLYFTAAGLPLRETRPKLDPQNEWFTCERSFRLRRKGSD